MSAKKYSMCNSQHWERLFLKSSTNNNLEYINMNKKEDGEEDREEVGQYTSCMFSH